MSSAIGRDLKARNGNFNFDVQVWVKFFSSLRPPTSRSTNDPTRLQAHWEGHVAELVVRMAVDNPRWGYTRIRGALSNLGHTIARTTVKRILHDHGVDPAPERSRHMPWKTFPGGLRSVHRRGVDAGGAQAVPRLLS